MASPDSMRHNCLIRLHQHHQLPPGKLITLYLKDTMLSLAELLMSKKKKSTTHRKAQTDWPLIWSSSNTKWRSSHRHRWRDFGDGPKSMESTTQLSCSEELKYREK